MNISRKEIKLIIVVSLVFFALLGFARINLSVSKKYETGIEHIKNDKLLSESKKTELIQNVEKREVEINKSIKTTNQFLLLSALMLVLSIFFYFRKSN